jgi:hypothetical protein
LRFLSECSCSFLAAKEVKIPSSSCSFISTKSSV